MLTCDTPAPQLIEESLFDNVHEQSVKQLLESIRKWNGNIIGIQGATNKFAKSVRNLIVQNNLSPFI